MKKGFTLIELLAVIVILAVLALIATPIVLNIIDDSKKNATLRSSENYIKAIEFSIAKSVMENKRLNDGTYNVMSNGNICLGTKTGDSCDNELIVEVSGETPESGTVTIKSRKIDSYEFTYASGFVVINGRINSEGEVVKLAPGLYDENDNLIMSWEELTTKEYTFEIDGDEVTTTILIVSGGTLQQFRYQESVHSFSSEHLIGKLVIDDSVTEIGYEAFAGCAGLTSVTIPDSVTSIEQSVFYGCTGLTSVTIPNSVTIIGESAFAGCTGLTSVIMGKGVEIVRLDAFYGCTSLKTINYKGTQEDWDSISFFNGWDNNTPTDKQINYNYKV